MNEMTPPAGDPQIYEFTVVWSNGDSEIYYIRIPEGGTLPTIDMDRSFQGQMSTGGVGGLYRHTALNMRHARKATALKRVQ